MNSSKYGSISKKNFLFINLLGIIFLFIKFNKKKKNESKK